ncbi:hypothetical protein APR12_006330 [Nocardia amikacinitolerans]|uniref:hypothetical protein n=1 Tax=Nocardia amikacinitolerans TaxID=756689 RepID=UPI000AB2F5F9|nr:hypothetical protein [Nocardia amikacinitolerans]MCP2320940.1 hypothetical protein [Nocardia amikacinitolerans]
MIRGREWTGFEAAALQEAMRKSIRQFAALLGVETTTVNNWRSGLSAVTPRPVTQEILDTTYAQRATPEDQERFEQIVAEGEAAWRSRHAPSARQTPAMTAHTDGGVDRGRFEAQFEGSAGRGSPGIDALAADVDDFPGLVADIETAFWAAGNVTDAGGLRPIPALIAASRAVTRLNMAGEYTTLALMLAPLITDLYRHTREGRPAEQRTAWDTLAQVAFDTSVVMRARGHLAVAWSAARAAEEAARTIDSRPGIAAATFVSSQVLLARPGSMKAALDCAESTAALVGSQAKTANDVQTVGMLHLQASLATAAVGGDPHDHLDHAAEYAARLDRPIETDSSSIIGNTTFGSSNVALWKMSVAMEARDPDAVLALAQKLKPQMLPTPGRAAQYWVEVGRAAASRRDYATSIDALLRAESIAPEHVRNTDTVQEVVGQMMRKAKRSLTTGDLGKLAQRVGVVVA